MTASRSAGPAERLKVGIIGGGAITQVAHLPVLKKMRSVDVQAICDTDLPKARALADRFSIKDAFDDIEELLRYEALDAVVICSPNHLHESHIMAALSADLHVLVEKPLAMSATSVQRILRTVEKHNRVVMVGMNHRYRPDVQIVRSFVQSGELGTIESIRGSWHVFRPGRTQLGWRQRRDQAGGGAMLDLGLSILDLGLWLGGSSPPARVSATLDAAGKERTVEQSGSAFVICENGTSIFVDVTWRHLGEGERFGVGIRGSKGTAGINPVERLERAARGGHGRLTYRLSQSRERLYRFLQSGVGPFPGGNRRRGARTIPAGTPDAAQSHGCHLPLGGRGERRESVKWGGRAAGRGADKCLWRTLRLLVLVCPLILLSGISAAQTDRPAAPPPRPPRLTVYLMTMGPGKAVWERFGHNAIWIHDPVRGTDEAYNYGLFDLRQEKFLVRFLQGRMWYWMQGFPAESYVQLYRRANRSVWIQELEMSPEAKRELQNFPRMERAAGEPLLPLRLLPRQLLDSSA